LTSQSSGGLDHEVQIVARLGPPAGPTRKAAPEQERDVRLPQRRRRLFERVFDVGERLLV
jgi:hypothetical protein